jgi:hypothetical protein
MARGLSLDVPVPLPTQAEELGVLDMSTQLVFVDIEA